MIKEENKLIELRPSKGLDSGVMPSLLASAGGIWSTGRNVWFREAHIEHALGSQVLVSDIHRKPQALAQAYVAGPRLYFEDLGVILYHQAGVETLIDALSSVTGASYDLCPYGSWLLATDNVAPLGLWQGSGVFASVGASQFLRAKIIKKLAQHVLVFNTDVLPSGFHWCSASDPTDTGWTPTANNSAGNLPIRDLDSEIVAVADLGAGLGVYSRETMLVVQYTGPPNWFGTPTQALSGIGAASKTAIVSLGRYNWGLGRGGIFLTDGSTFNQVDRPAIDRWLQDNVDWARSSEIAGYYDEQLMLVVWAVPLLTGGISCVAVDPKNKTSIIDTGKRTFTYLGTDLGVGLDRSVFDYPIVAKSDGIYYNSVKGTVAGDFALTSQLFSAGTQAFLKSWEFLICEGEFTDEAEIRVGFTEAPTLASVAWDNWQPLTYKVPIGPRESVFLALDFRSTESIKISGITVYGNLAGSVG